MTPKFLIFNFKFLKNKKGFTLIELLVVISIIGILAALGTARYLTAEKSARDTERKSDLGQYRVALENYANVNGSVYPVVAYGDISSLCDLGDPTFAATYLSGNCLNDPLGGTNTYHFASDVDMFVIWASLEGSSEDYEVCSNGRSGKITEGGNDAICDL